MASSIGKHLDGNGRKRLYDLLCKGASAKIIGEMLFLSPTSIMREIKKHRIIFKKSTEGDNLCHRCDNFESCKLHNRCGRKTCSARCCDCKQLKVPSDCNEFKLLRCNIEKRFPLVCDGCSRKHKCNKNNYYYDPVKAQEEYRQTLVDKRKGINLSVDEYHMLNNTIQLGVDKKQSIHHIVNANQDKIPVSVKTVYNYINNNKLTTKRIDLPRAVSLKKRKSHLLKQYEYNENSKIDRSGRRYSDWIVFKAKNRIVVNWEMDFLGAPINSDQIVLVLTIPLISFTLLFPLTRPDQKAVKDIFDMLYNDLGDELFKKVFEVILTDRDTRFNDYNAIELNSKTGEIRTHLFFCNPQASNEKPNVENMNQQLRSIFPKGVSLSNISLQQGYKFVSNMNARILSSIDNSTPTKMFIDIFGKEVFDRLNLTIIDPKDVQLKPIKIC